MNTYNMDKMYESYADTVERMQMWLDESERENKELKEHIEKYEHYCKTTGIEELMKENKKYKEVIDKAIDYVENGDLLYLASKCSIIHRNNVEVVAICDRLNELLDILKEVE